MGPALRHIFRLITDSLLFLVSAGGVFVFMLFLVLWAFFRYVFLNGGAFETRARRFSEYLHRCAFAFDETGGIVGAPFFNDTMLIDLDSTEVYFGLIVDNDIKTISYNLAYNYRGHNLTGWGKFWAHVTEFFDKGHMNKALRYNEGPEASLILTLPIVPLS